LELLTSSSRAGWQGKQLWRPVFLTILLTRFGIGVMLIRLEYDEAEV
jgi:hypothetical protein